MSLSGIVLVTGGAGFIGSNIVEALLESGARVRVIDNLCTGHRENLQALRGNVDLIEADIASEDAVRRATENVEVVFHEAALPSVPRSVVDPRATHQACIDGTFNLLLAARDNKVRRLVYAASSSAYGDQPTLPKVEDMRPEPRSPYAAAKLMGEYYCQVFTRVYNLKTVSLRYFNVFGPRQDPSSMYSGVISRFIDALMTGETPVIYGDGETSRDFSYISNVVNSNLRAAESASAVGQVLNIASGQRTTLNQLLQILKQITGNTTAIPEYQPERAGDVKHSLADISLAQQHLGFEPVVDLEDGLRRTVDWWKTSRYSR